MTLEIPNNLDLLTNIKTGLEYRIRILKEQYQSLIRKNQTTDIKEKQIYDLLIKEIHGEINMVYAFLREIIGFIKSNYDLTNLVMPDDIDIFEEEKNI